MGERLMGEDSEQFGEGFLEVSFEQFIKLKSKEFNSDEKFYQQHYQEIFEGANPLDKLIMIGEAFGKERLGVLKKFKQIEVDHVLLFLDKEIDGLRKGEQNHQIDLRKNYLEYSRTEILQGNLPYLYKTFKNKTNMTLLRERVYEGAGLAVGENNNGWQDYTPQASSVRNKG